MNVLKEIALSWKREATEEVNEYFYSPPWMDNLIEGNALYIIGRKGTGKSAIARYIKKSAPNSCSSAFSYREYLDELKCFYQQKDILFTEYRLVWELTIYAYLCKILLDSNDLSRDAKKNLKVIKPLDLKSFYKNIYKPRGGSVSVPIPIDPSLVIPTNFTIDAKKKNLEEWTILQLRDFYKLIFQENSSRDVSYYLLFDELDEGFRDIYKRADIFAAYKSSLAALFAAAKTVRDEMFSKKRKVFPLVFLRSDIYELLQDNDRNKWNDNAIHLVWGVEHIKGMLEHRIKIASERSGNNVSDRKKFWNVIFKDELIPIERKACKANMTKDVEKKIFDFIHLRTLARPRDYIMYIQLCADWQYKHGKKKISGRVVKKTAGKYAGHLVAEFKDELGQVIPGISEVFKIFSEWGWFTFSFRDFDRLYKGKKLHTELADCPLSSEAILRLLFDNSVLGNSARGGVQRRFKQDNPDASLNIFDRMCYHSGILPAVTKIRKDVSEQLDLKKCPQPSLIPAFCDELEAYVDETSPTTESEIETDAIIRINIDFLRKTAFIKSHLTSPMRSTLVEIEKKLDSDFPTDDMSQKLYTDIKKIFGDILPEEETYPEFTAPVIISYPDELNE